MLPPRLMSVLSEKWLCNTKFSEFGASEDGVKIFLDEISKKAQPWLISGVLSPVCADPFTVFT